MDSRSEVKRQYKEEPRQAGVFHVKNTANGRVLLGSSKNLHGCLNKHRFLLSIKTHWNKKLQEDWNRFGPDAFVFEVLEVVRQTDEPDFNLEDELSLLEEAWIEKAQPYGEGGYNRPGSIRE